MTVFTRRASEIFAPETSDGRPRGPVITHARTWGTEVEYSQLEVGSWTPAFTFETPGNSNIVLSAGGIAAYYRFGKLYLFNGEIQTTTFTHTTASGEARITGLPITPSENSSGHITNIRGITKANYTRFGVRAVAGQTYLTVVASGSGQPLSVVTAADMPSAGSLHLQNAAIWLMSS